MTPNKHCCTGPVGVLTWTSELWRCSTAPLRRVTVSLLFSMSRKTLAFSLLHVFWGFFSETEKTLIPFFICNLAFSMSASLSNIKVSSTSVLWLFLQTENFPPGLCGSGWFMFNDPFDSCLSSAPSKDFEGSSAGERDGHGSGFHPSFLRDSSPPLGTETTGWDSSTCRFITSSSRCSWTSTLMLLMVAKDAVSTFRASGEEACGGKRVWTGFGSKNLFCSLFLRRFSSLCVNSRIKLTHHCSNDTRSFVRNYYFQNQPSSIFLFVTNLFHSCLNPLFWNPFSFFLAWNWLWTVGPAVTAAAYRVFPWPTCFSVTDEKTNIGNV